ncbi:MAG: phospholipase D family protein [Gaiellaceae bacterium]
MTEKLAARAMDWRLMIDRPLGRVMSSAVVAHHRRRLARIGWESALDRSGGPWAQGDPPPRAGCSVEVLIDGEQALPRVAATLAEAQSHVYLAGWQFSPSLALVRGGERVILRNLLAELAERVDVYVLAWAGAPLPLFRPSRATVRRIRDELCRGTDIHCALDDRERPLHCHHEKTIVVDDRVAFVGGIDLTFVNGDRFDGNDHVARAQVGWHDVSSRIEGPAVSDVAEHFRMRWHEVTGERLVGPASPNEPLEGANSTVQVVRTVPEKVYAAVPRGDFRILESYLGALRSAQKLVYIENQFLWSPQIADVLRAKLEHPPLDAFRLLVVLPAKPNAGSDDTRGMLGELVEADAGAGRLLACTLYARHGRLDDPIYVHAKVAIVDDAWLTIGSANLNEHSLFNDTEMNIVSDDVELARETRLRLWAEHLELPLSAISGDSTDVIDRHWKPIAHEQQRRRLAGQHLTHRLVRLPEVSRRSERLLGPLQGLLVDG